jgi:hypothetical protein
MLERQDGFVKDLHRQGEQILKGIGPDEPLVVVTGRPYNLYDERLNLRLGQSGQDRRCRRAHGSHRRVPHASRGIRLHVLGLGAQI